MQCSICWSLSALELACAKLPAYLYTVLQSGTHAKKLIILKYRRSTQNKADFLQSLMGKWTSHNSRGKKGIPLYTPISCVGKIRLQLNTPPAPLSSHHDHHQVKSLQKMENFWKAFIGFILYLPAEGFIKSQTSESSSFWSTCCVHWFSFFFWQRRITMKLCLRNMNSSALHIKMKHVREDL